MTAILTALWSRGLAFLGRVSMYRLVLLALATLALIALILSLFGLVAPGPLQLLVTLAVLVIVSTAADVAAQSVLSLPRRYESGLITAGILLFVLRPTLEPIALLGIGVAAVAASVSKYVLAWRGRHIFNPAAVGATAVTLLALVWPSLGASAWWVGNPFLLGPVLVLGVLVAWRAEKLRVVATFWVIALGVAFFRVAAQYQEIGQTVDSAQLLGSVVWSSPFFFLGAFMVSEPLTQPPRRWQQLTVAALVGVLAGWPIVLGPVTLGQERALLIGNLLAFAFAFRGAVRLRLVSRENLTPTVRQLTFRASNRMGFQAGQYLELEVPHRHPDPRGTRREFSIVSAPSDLPELRIAFREAQGASQSSYKRALAAAQPDDDMHVTGVWGDFLLPHRESAPVLLVAAGIGVTPFISQLREARLRGQDRDIVVIYVASEASELVFRDELQASGARVIVFTRDEPADLPRTWTWARGVRLDADGLVRIVPDLSSRHAYISGPPGLIADLAPALSHARSVTSDAFAGY